MPSDLNVLELWYAALRNPYGVKVITNDVNRMKAKLYAERKAADDPALAALMIQTSSANPTGELFINHRLINTDEGASDAEGQ